MKTLLDISSLSRIEVMNIFQNAEKYIKIKHDTILQGKTILLAFFESSTRTRVSFEIAVRRLAGTPIMFSSVGSSQSKGESFIDTIHTLSQYDIDCWIVRHPHSFAPHLLHAETQSSVINAGDGSHQHPTQAILDAFTLYRKWGSLEGKKILIVGDILHSRVARSSIDLYKSLGAEVAVSAPGTLLPRVLNDVRIYPTIHDGISSADAVITLRLQKERMQNGLIASEQEYARFFGMNERILVQYPSLIVLHPGPANYGVELTMECMNHPNVMVREQVKNGLAIRMAVLRHCLL